MEKEKTRYQEKITPLNIGERIAVSLDGEHFYPTLLEDMTEDDHLIISVPLYRGIPVIMKVEQHVQFFFFRENGRFCIDVQVEEIILRGPLRLISLLPLTEPHRQQRRDSFRLRIGLSALIRPFSGKISPPDQLFAEADLNPWEEVLTNNLSETGVSINSIVDHRTGDCLHLKITLDHAPDHLEQIQLLGIVRQVQVIEYLGRQYRLGVEFLPYSDNLRRLIAKFVIKKQQQVIRTELDYN